MKPFLVIDCTIDRDSWGAHEITDLLRIAGAQEILVRRAPAMDLPPLEALERGKFCGIVVSGSKTSCLSQEPWVVAMDHFLKSALDLKLPYFGICYGHQSLIRVMALKAGSKNAAEFLGPSLGAPDQTPEYGWIAIKKTGPSEITRNLPDHFFSFARHQESARKLPDGMRSFLSSPQCPIQGVEVVGRPFFGVQFHPERSLEGGESSIAALLKQKDTRDFVFGKGQGKKCFDPKIGVTLMRNFVSIAQK